MAFTKVSPAGLTTTASFTLGDINVTGVGTFASLDVSGNVSVAGTITYEDVTNIDSVGLITARSGIHVTGGSVGIGTDDPDDNSQLHLYNHSGNAKFTIETNETYDAYINFSGYTSEASIGYEPTSNSLIFSNAADGLTTAERLRITSEGRVGIGTTTPVDSLLQVIGDVRIGNSIGDIGRQIVFNANRGSAYDTIANLNFEWNSTTIAQIRAQAGSDTTNKDDGHLVFYTAPEGSIQERLRITSEGDVGINATPSQNDMPGVKPRLHVVGISSSSEFNTVARFQAGGDSDNTGSAIVLNHANDRGIVIQGGRYLGNSSFGAIKAIDNVGRISDAISIFGASNAGVSSVSIYTGEATTTTERFTIDSSGRVRMPYQPGFRVYEPVASEGSIITFGATEYNIGSHMNTATGVFTAPIAGRYLFTFAILSGNPMGTYVRIGFCKNSTSMDQTFGDALWDGLSTYGSPGIAMIINLAANDTIRLRTEGSGVYGTSYGSFSGILLA